MIGQSLQTPDSTDSGWQVTPVWLIGSREALSVLPLTHQSPSLDSSVTAWHLAASASDVK